MTEPEIDSGQFEEFKISSNSVNIKNDENCVGQGVVPDGVFPPALKNQLDKVLSGIKINKARKSFTEMKDYEKGIADSIYSVEQSEASNTHGNTMPKMKHR